MNNKGMSLFEILIVIVVFAILGILTTRIIFLSMRGSAKSTSILKVKENLDYAVSVMERNLRNATSLDATQCAANLITYTDENYVTSTFSCVNIGSGGYVASGSARLTDSNIAITECSFVCVSDDATNNPSVSIYLKGQEISQAKIGSNSADISTQVFLRQY